MPSQFSSTEIPSTGLSEPIGVGTFKLSPKSMEYVEQVLRSERLSYGPFLQKFERVFSAAHECRFGVMTNSGTSSLLIALHALKIRHGWKDGDEVLVPAVTFVATANVCLQLNLKPVFVDVDPIFYEITAEAAEKAITPRTRAIIPVHLFGLPCAMDSIMDLARRHQLRVIEDSCETMFTEYQGRSVGSFGDIGCFSTYVAHLLVTGVGGLCTTNDPDLMVLMRSLMNHGRDSIYLSVDDAKGKTVDEMRLIIQRRFRFVHPGYSFRVTEMEGALGLAQFEDRAQMMEKRQFNAAYFLEKLSPLRDKIQLPARRRDAGHAFMMFPAVVREGSKKTLVEFLEMNGIETREMLPLVNQPVYQELLGTKEADFPVAEWINQGGFYFGCHQDLKDFERKHIVETFFRFFERKSVAKKKSAVIVFSHLKPPVDMLALQSRLESLRVSVFDEFFIADSGENPDTVELFRQCGFQVVSGSPSKGALLKSVLKRTDAENLVLMGIDGADSAGDAGQLLLQLQTTDASLVVGSRFVSGGARYSSRALTGRSLGNRFFSFLLGILFRVNVTDANNLLRAIRRKDLESWALQEEGDEFAFEMTVSALGAGAQYLELPVQERSSLFNYRRSNRWKMASKFFLLLFRQAFRKSLEDLSWKKALPQNQ